LASSGQTRRGCAKRQTFCFVYDEQAKGVVGMTPSFGSEEFNDHHFRYGYFLYAAAVLAPDDPALAQRYAPVLNLLAADIGSSANGGKGSSSETASRIAGRSTRTPATRGHRGPHRSRMATIRSRARRR
jgi:endo-1,3(4)-beta-glucanase